MADPTFKPGDTVWHVMHGKVTLEESIHPESPNTPLFVKDFGTGVGRGWFRADGKSDERHVGRVLYTLKEAERYGWYKPEPRVVEFEAFVHPYLPYYPHITATALQPFKDKRVKVRVEEVQD